MWVPICNLWSYSVAYNATTSQKLIQEKKQNFENQMVIFGHFVKPTVKQNGQKMAVFGCELPSVKKNGKFNRYDGLT